MENYIVSARKYRPETFDTVVGQSAITTTLKNAIKSGHLAQAFLFCGPRGVGKTTCARILAKTINCLNPTEDMEACGECESCVSFKNSNSYNIYELDAASNNSVDDIRSLVEQVRIPPQVGKYKIYIIDEVHMLSQAAFNAFLKTLEEPPAYAKFILATTEKHKIIPTILSRCQIFDFKRIKIEDIAGHLANIAAKEGVTAEPDALHIIAQKADGGLRDALSMFDQLVSFAGNHLTYDRIIDNLNVLDYDYYFKIVDAFLAGDVSTCLILFNQVMERGFDGQHFITGLGEHLRNLLVCKDPGTIELIEVGENIKEKYLKQSQTCTVPFIIKALDVNNQCDQNYKGSNNKRLCIEIALMKICSFQMQMNDVPAQPVSIPHPTPRTSNPVPAHPDGHATQAITPPQPLSTPVQNIEPLQSSTSNPQPSFRSSTPSLKNIGQPTEDEKKKSIIEEVAPVENKPLSKNTLEALILEFAKQIETTSPSTSSVLIASNPTIDERNLICLEVVNRIQESDIKDVRLDLLGFLKKRAENNLLQIEIKINEQRTKEVLYSPQDKYNKMKEENPHLSELRKALDLDLEL